MELASESNTFWPPHCSSSHLSRCLSHCQPANMPSLHQCDDETEDPKEGGGQRTAPGWNESSMGAECLDSVQFHPISVQFFQQDAKVEDPSHSPPPKDIHMISHKTFRTPTSKLSRGSITSVQTTAEPACSPTISNKWEVDGSGPCRPWNQQELAPLPCWLREMRRTFARLRVSSNLHGLDNVGIEAHVDHHTSHHDDT